MIILLLLSWASRHVEWNSVDTSTKNENADGTRSEVTSGNTSVGLSGISGGENDTSTSSGHFRYSRPEGSANSIHVQFEGEQVRHDRVVEAIPGLVRIFIRCSIRGSC